MKKYLILVIILLLAVAAYFYFSTDVVEAPKVDDSVPEENVQSNLTITTSSKQVFEEGYEVDFKFPVTGDVKIDTEINKTVNSLIDSFSDEASSFLPHPAGFNRPYTLNGSYNSYSGGEYNSFVFLVSVDFGGAHPNHFYRTLTFDKLNDVVLIEDFLSREAHGSKSVNLISDLTQEIIADKLGENLNREMLEAGAGPKIDNFKNFYVDGSDVVFVFEPYAVAAYAFSTQEARINLSELKK